MSTKVKTVPVNLGTLESLGAGELGVLFKNQLMRVARDCLDRPHDESKRKVVIEIIVAPVTNQKGEFLHCDAIVECKAKVPTFRSSPYQLATDMNGFAVNQTFPNEIDQPSLLEDPDDEEDDEDE